MKRLVILFLFILSAVAYSQEDSLHLVFTITGDSNEDPIFNCKTLGDINGDGFSDFAVIFRKYAKLYYGSNSFLLSNYQKIEPNDTTKLDNIRIFGIGDINKDGYDDFLISTIKAIGNPAYPKGKVYVYLGGEEISDTPIFQFEDFCLTDALGASASGGDINGDGYNDIIIGNPHNWCDGIGRVYFIYGGDTLSDNPDVTLQSGTPEDFFGEHLCMNGNINGDGYDDLIIAAPDQNGDPNYNGKIYFYFGDSTISLYADLVLDMHSPSTQLKTFILPDFNGDGINDLFISSTSNKLYFGSYTFDTTNYLIMPAEGSGYIGDINNDGYSDLLLTNTYYLNSAGIMVGDAEIYLGSNNPDTTMDYFLEGETKWSGFGRGSTLGDINGDGYDDFFILAYYYPDVNNPLGKIYVYSMKKILVDVNDENEQYPKKFSLEQNYPNPFNPTTTINYSVRENGFVQLKVYDVLGKEIATLVKEEKSAGNYSVKFNGNNLPSGVYFYTLRVNNFVQSRKMVLLR